jgi:spore germination protein KC
VDNESDYGDRREKEILNLNEAVHRKIKEDIEEGVRLVQKKFKADIIGIGRSIHRQLPKEWDKIKDRWEVIYPQVQVSVEPHVIIENVGIVNKPIGVVEEDIVHD